MSTARALLLRMCLTQTIRNRPHEGGLRARRPVVGPVLTGQHRRARLAFATEHQNWQICPRRLVLFTDVSRFYLSTCDRRDRLWRRHGECYPACNIIQHDWFGGGSVMAWGGISLEGRTDLYRLNNGTLTAIRHQDKILRPLVRPYAGAVGPGFLLVHNNARPHVARVCRQFLENEGIDTIDWPTGSPDLNPIEHLWDIVFRSIRRHQVALQTVQELSDALVQIWEEIPQDTIRLALNYRTEICSTKIVDIFCNNPSLMKLLCGDITTSNSYGLFILTFYDGLALLIVAFTYIQILVTVVVKRQSDAKTLLAHLYGAGAYVILSAMAYDRYVAICCPLKYNTLMSPNNLLKIITIMWTLHFVLIGLLLALNYRTEICSTKIVDIFCNNPSLMKLLCGDITTSNSYGLFVLTFYNGLALLIVVFTYIQILITVVVKRQSDAKSKALQTCGTHLIVFLSYEFCACFSMIAHRFESASPILRKALGASVIICPPIVNPLIYGLKMKEIRQNLFLLFRKKVSPIKQKNKQKRSHRKK
ncbi:hypothetical protein NFI96_005717 [Prochilodus magdalenae]|nr:hypothetical protein NFI96_005717 [Prochilodus magdalenae]